MADPFAPLGVVFIIVILGAALPLSFPLQGDPEILFDKSKYVPFDEATVMIKYQKANSDHSKAETITAHLYTTSMSKMKEHDQELLLTETSTDSGIFVAHIRLTPDIKIRSGDIVVHRDDDLIVEFNASESRLFTGRAHVDFYTSEVMLSEPTYKVTDMARIIVIDPDENRHPDTIDTLPVRVWSNTDRGGLLVILRETDASSGIFEELLTFTLNEESSGTRLRVSEGDTLTVKYTDKTLPPPAALSSNGFETIEVKELFAFAQIRYLIPPLERAIVSEPKIVDENGESVSSISALQQVIIQSEITNNQPREQPFAYIVQIKDAEDATVSLSWITGKLALGEPLKASQSWTPDTLGRYSVEVFVWESVYNPNALSPVRHATIEVF